MSEIELFMAARKAQLQADLPVKGETDHSEWMDDPYYWLAKAEGAFVAMENCISDYYDESLQTYWHRRWYVEYQFWERTMWLRLLTMAQTEQKGK